MTGMHTSALITAALWLTLLVPAEASAQWILKSWKFGKEYPVHEYRCSGTITFGYTTSTGQHFDKVQGQADIVGTYDTGSSAAHEVVTVQTQPGKGQFELSWSNCSNDPWISSYASCLKSPLKTGSYTFSAPPSGPLSGDCVPDELPQGEIPQPTYVTPQFGQQFPPSGPVDLSLQVPKEYLDRVKKGTPFDERWAIELLRLGPDKKPLQVAKVEGSLRSSPFSVSLSSAWLDEHGRGRYAAKAYVSEATTFGRVTSLARTVEWQVTVPNVARGQQPPGGGNAKPGPPLIETPPIRIASGPAGARKAMVTTPAIPKLVTIPSGVLPNITTPQPPWVPPANRSELRLPAAQTAAARPYAFRPGEKLLLQDGRILTKQGGALALLGRRGEVLRSFPPDAEVVVGPAGDVSVRMGAVSEPLGLLKAR